jgi:hypothetical protein
VFAKGRGIGVRDAQSCGVIELARVGSYMLQQPTELGVSFVVKVPNSTAEPSYV